MSSPLKSPQASEAPARPRAPASVPTLRTELVSSPVAAPSITRTSPLLPLPVDSYSGTPIARSELPSPLKSPAASAHPK